MYIFVPQFLTLRYQQYHRQWIYNSHHFFTPIKNFSATSYSTSPASNSSITFSFYTSATSLYIWDKTHCICVFTDSSLSFILMYNLHTIMNPETFDNVLLKICGLATSVTPPPLPANNTLICVCCAASCSCSCYMIVG